LITAVVISCILISSVCRPLFHTVYLLTDKAHCFVAVWKDVKRRPCCCAAQWRADCWPESLCHWPIPTWYREGPYHNKRVSSRHVSLGHVLLVSG